MKKRGKKEEFQDVVSLKYFIRDYAKYLGLDGEELVDEFNEFLFDFTSKIPLEEIEKAKLNNVNKKEVVSPYTSEVSNKKGVKVIIAVVIVLCLLVIGYFVMSGIKGNDFKDDNVTYVIGR